ncbi:hypothetical protein [Aeromonas veronii]|uniref:hypothetical protein n=1 Tax=Aeromonas veronii TaxID=654 RepID=UPI003672C404
MRAKIKETTHEYRFDARKERYVPDPRAARLKRADVYLSKGTQADQNAKEKAMELFTSRLEGEYGSEQQQLQEMFKRVKESNLYYQRHIVVRELKRK